MVESQPSKLLVAGSIPVSRSTRTGEIPSRVPMAWLVARSVAVRSQGRAKALGVTRVTSFGIGKPM